VPIGQNIVAKETGRGIDPFTGHFVIKINHVDTVHKFFENNNNPKMQENVSLTNNMVCPGSRTLDLMYEKCVALPPLPRLHHLYYTVIICEFVNDIYMSLWLILLQCK